MAERKGSPTGPDFLTIVMRHQSVPFKLVDLLADRGFAISIAFWKNDEVGRSDRDGFAINASDNARRAWDQITTSVKYKVLQALDLGIWRGDQGISTFNDAVNLTNFNEKTKKRFLALYEYNYHKFYLFDSEKEARKKARRFSNANVDTVRESLVRHLKDLVEQKLDKKQKVAAGVS